MVSDSAPEVPVTVIVAGPVVAVPPAVRVSTLEPVAGLVPKAAVTPAGTPEAERVTPPVNPLRLVTVMVSVALVPWLTERLDAEGESVKPGAVEAVATNVVILCAGRL